MLGLPPVYCLIMLVNGRERRHESPKSHCTHSHNFSFLMAFDSGSFAIPGWVRRASFSCACRRLLSTSVLAPCIAVKLFSHAGKQWALLFSLILLLISYKILGDTRASILCFACKFFGIQAFAFYPVGFHSAKDSPEIPNVCGDGGDVCGWFWLSLRAGRGTQGLPSL